MKNKFFDTRKLDELTDEVFEKMPPALNELRDEMRLNFRACIESFLDKMNLVSREEYDVQMAVLDKLKKRIAELESRIDEKNSSQ